MEGSIEQMKATLLDAKKALGKPRNLLKVAAVAVLSVLLIYVLGYVTWRRLVMPVEMFVAGWIILRIAERIRNESVYLVIVTAGRGMNGASVILFIAGLVDSVFFGNIGHAMFIGNALLWLWIPFQLHRLFVRLTEMSPAEQEQITESSDVVIAILSHRKVRIREELDKWEAQKEKLGLESSSWAH